VALPVKGFTEARNRRSRGSARQGLHRSAARRGLPVPSVLDTAWQAVSPPCPGFDFDWRAQKGGTAQRGSDRGVPLTEAQNRAAWLCAWSGYLPMTRPSTRLL